MKREGNKKELSFEAQVALINTLKTRFEKNKKRHQEIDWASVESRLQSNPEKLWSLFQMEETGGEPDVISREKKPAIFFFTIARKKVPGAAAAFATTGKGRSRGKNTNRQITPWTWQWKWVLNF